MTDETRTHIPPEVLIQESFDGHVMRVFEECSTIEEFINKFNEVFPAGSSYLKDINHKLDSNYIFSKNLISCTGSAITFESFIRQKFSNQYRVLMCIDNQTSKGHTVVVLIPDNEVQEISTSEWLDKKIVSGESGEILAFSAKKEYGLSRFDVTELPVFKKRFETIQEYIKNRASAFKVAKYADV